MELNKNEIIHDIGNKLSDFKILTELGRGSYGIVYKVYSYVDGNIYVIKKMDFKHMKEKQQKEAWKEATILKKIHHPHVIKYYNSFLEDDCLYIVMEYAEGGDLFSLAKTYKKNKKRFSESELWRFLYEILLGLNYLHSNNIIHRDIKLLNLFLGKNKSIKIGDMGVSKIVSNINALHCTKVGTPLYLSPELIKQIPYDFKVDIWSVGCSMYHMACLEPPFKGDNLIVLGNNIVKIPHKPISAMYCKEFGKLIDSFLSKKPDLRPSAKDSLELIPSSVKENYNNRLSNKQTNFDSSSEENNELVTKEDNLKKTIKNASSKSIYEAKNSNENNNNNYNYNKNNEIILSKNIKDQNNINIRNLISNNNHYEENKLSNKENPTIQTSFNIKNALNKNPNSKTYSNNFFNKDSMPKIISGISNQYLNVNSNNKVINLEPERKLLNINNLCEESFDNKNNYNNDNNNCKNLKNNGRLSPSKANSKSKSNLFSNNSKSINNNINKEKQTSHFNLYKENPYLVKINEGDIKNNNDNIKKDDKNLLNDYKIKSSQINYNMNINNNEINIESKSAMNFFVSEAQKKHLDEKNNNKNKNSTNNVNISSPKSSFKNKNDNEKKLIFENNFNHYNNNINEKTNTNKSSPIKLTKHLKENEVNIDNNSLYNSKPYSPKKTECREKENYKNNENKISKSKLNKLEENNKKENSDSKNTNFETNNNYIQEVTKTNENKKNINKNINTIPETRLDEVALEKNILNKKDRSKEIKYENIESELNIISSNNENDFHYKNNNNQFDYKKRIFSSKIRKEKILNIRPSTANNLGSDRRIFRNGKAQDLGSFLNNENLANKILYDINDKQKNSNENHSALNSNNNFIKSNNLFYNNKQSTSDVNSYSKDNIIKNYNHKNKIENIKDKDNYNLYANLNRLSNIKSEEATADHKNSRSNRPFTANLIRANRNGDTNLDTGLNNNIINININVFNIQNNNNNNLNNIIGNNNRFLNPAAKTNLIYVNEDFKKNKNDLNDLPNFDDKINEVERKKILNNIICENFNKKNIYQNLLNGKEISNENKIKKNLRPFSSLKNSKIGGFSNNVNLINFNNNLNIKKTAEVIFDNLAKTIGKGDIENKVLTIDDLK